MASRCIDRSTRSVLVDPYTLRSESKFEITLYSEPIKLGEFAISIDGSLQVNIPLPKGVEAGYHTLVIEGKSTSGEPLSLYQFIMVTSGIKDDIDGDDILDAEDRCTFIIEWYDEQTGENVCKEAVTRNNSRSNLYVPGYGPYNNLNYLQYNLAIGAGNSNKASANVVDELDSHKPTSYDESNGYEVDKENYNNISGWSRTLLAGTIFILVVGAVGYALNKRRKSI